MPKAGVSRRSVLPPWGALRLAAMVVAVLSAATALGYQLGGWAVVLGMVLGALSAAQACLVAIAWSSKAVIGLLSALAASGGFLVAGDPWLSAVLVAALGLLQWPLNRQSAGIGVMLPVLVAICASTGLRSHPLLIGVAVLAGYLVLAGLVSVVKVSLPPRPVVREQAVRHAIATALAAGTTMLVATLLAIDHGYWVVLTLVFVLRPAGGTRVAAWDRVIGTVLGVLIAVALALTLPDWAVLVVCGVCVVLVVGWAAAQDVKRQTVYSTPVVVLVSSSGLVGSTVYLAAGRVVLTLVGCAVAIATAGLLRCLDRRGSLAGAKGLDVIEQ